MMPPDRCEPIAIMLAPYTAGELSEIEIHRVERHLAHCPACQQELARERQLRELMAAQPPVRCPDAVTDAILAAVDAEPRGHATPARDVVRPERQTSQPRDRAATRGAAQRRQRRRGGPTWPSTVAAASLLAAAVLLAMVLPRNPAPHRAPGTPGSPVDSGTPAWTQAELEQARDDVSWALAFTADIIDRTEKRSLEGALRLLRPAARSAADGSGFPSASGGQG